jgi:hypothetical protein
MAHTSSTPTFPVPASARVHPTTRSPSTATTAPAKATVPPTASIPTTTYVPSGGTPLPSTTSTGAAATVPTTATPFKSTLLGTRARTHARAQHSETLSTGAIAIAAIAALLVLACLGWALARQRAFEPHWMLSLRHAMAETGFRASATWAEFSDWVRLGH